MYGTTNAQGLGSVLADKFDAALISAIAGNKNYRGEFSTSATYAVGDIVLVETANGPRFMEATAAVTAGAFDSSKWTSLVISSSSSGSGESGDSTDVNTTMLVKNSSTGEYETVSYSNTSARVALEDATDGSFAEPSWSGSKAVITEVYDDATETWSTI